MAIGKLLTWLSVASAALAAPALFSEDQVEGSNGPVGTSFGIPGPLGEAREFDYVIIGGGTAGLTVAARLSEDPSVAVAVIEAGGFYELTDGNHSQIPAFYAKNFNQTPVADTIQPLIDWGYITEPQTGLANRRFHYSQGKTLSGSAGRNSNIFTRGTVGYFQRWAELVGDETWSWENVLPYFKKSVAFTPPNEEKIGANVSIPYDESAYSPSGGPLHVTYSNYYQPMNPGLIQGFEALNFSSQEGFVSGRMDGYGVLAVSIDPETQIKDSSETAFMTQALNNTKFRVFKNTIAKKIMFDGTTATGVQVETAGYPYTLMAKREVIVSAGVTRSPQMLMVSGIGPRDILAQQNIPVIVDRNVGQNWQDHCAFEFTYAMNVPGNAALEGNEQYLQQATQSFLADRTGPLTSWGGDILAFEKLPAPYRDTLNQSALDDLATYPDDHPEIEWLTASRGPKNAMSSYVTFTPAILAVISKGTIGLTSADPADNPTINPNTFSSPTEQALGVQIFKRLQELVNATGLTTGPEMKVGLPPTASDEQILEGIKQTALPWYHGVASCPMGREEDPNAVVDGEGRVFGTQGLRVVDASVVPFPAPGHSMAPVYMVAEKISEAIKRGAAGAGT